MTTDAAALPASGMPPEQPLLPLVYRVASVREETSDTATIELQPVDRAIAAPRPGQFAMLWAPGVGEVPISYSGTSGERLEHTVRAVGPVTGALTRCRPGDLLGVRGPFGNGWPLQAARGGDLVLVAGGIGLAPLRSAVLSVLSDRGAYRRVVLAVGARTIHGLPFRGDLDRWWGEERIEVRTTVDSPCRHWDGAVGVVTQQLQRVDLDPAATTAMMCGPEIMMRAVAAALIDRGVPEQRIHASLERNMQCGIGICGHCQLGAPLICADGPVFGWDRVGGLLGVAQR